MSRIKKTKKSLLQRLIISLFTLLVIITSSFTIYQLYLLTTMKTNKIYYAIVIIIIIDLIFIVRSFIVKSDTKRKKHSFKIYIITSFIFATLIGGAGFIINHMYGAVDNMNKKYVTYSSSLIALKKSEFKQINDISDATIGILSDKKSPDGNIIPKEIIKENDLEDDNTISEYEDYTSMLSDLYSEKIELVFMPSSYATMFSNITQYEKISEETNIIVSKDKKMKKTSTAKSETESLSKSVSEPFTILLMGIDSTEEVLEKNAVANGDTLILITFNPKTINATMMSIPRDSYVPIACFNDKAENKITHAAAYGNDCMINTIEEYFDINIDYYAKINFKGFVKLIDAVGGVTVDVPKKLCTDSSDRTGEICINKGVQTLSGEKALVFARNRKQLGNGDFGRAQHQQEIVQALLEKLKTINSISDFSTILDTISNSMDTNLTTKQILSFYNVAKDIQRNTLISPTSSLINIDKLYLQGDGQMIYDERAKMILWDYVPNKESKKDIIEAMKVNLGLKKHKEIKEFSYSINEPYEKETIGYGPYDTNYKYELLPDFTGDSYESAKSYANKNSINVTFIGNSGYVIKQSEPSGRRLDKINNSVVLTLSTATKSQKEEEEKRENQEKKEKQEEIIINKSKKEEIKEDEEIKNEKEEEQEDNKQEETEKRNDEDDN